MAKRSARRARSTVLRWLLEPEPPGLGLDLRSNELSLARLADKRGKAELDLCVTSPLPPGCLQFNMLEPNIRDGDTLTQVIESVLLRSGAAGSKRIALTLPDYLARVSVVELAEAPRSSAETVDVLKFRLKKSLPFDVDQARLAYEPLDGHVMSTPTYLAGHHFSNIGRMLPLTSRAPTSMTSRLATSSGPTALAAKITQLALHITSFPRPLLFPA